MSRDADSPCAAVPVSAASGIAPGRQSLDWGTFWMLFASRASVLFFLAAVVCFFAYNWADMPPFAKFSLIAALMAASGGLAVWRGQDSFSGSLALLSCGLLAGPLLAVYGQVYQTGADAWELFRAWTLFLIPLAVAGRNFGLCVSVWVVGSLWGIFYMMQRAVVDDTILEGLVLYMIYGQALLFAAWEGLMFLYAPPGLAFRHSRWFPRIWAFCLLGYLTYLLFDVLSLPPEASAYWLSWSGALFIAYMALVGGGALFYSRIRYDVFMLATGLLSLILLLLAVVSAHWGTSSISGILICLLALIGSSAAAGKILLSCHAGAARENSAATRQEGENGIGITASEASSPWPTKVLLILCAWIAAPFLVVLIALMFPSARAEDYLVLSLACMGLGAVFSRRKGLFLRQAGLCLSLTASISASVCLVIVLDFENPVGFSFFVCFLVGYVLITAPAYRFFAVLVCCLAIFFQMESPDALLFAGTTGDGELESVVWSPLSRAGSIVFSILPGALYCLCLAGLWERQGRKDGAGPQNRPLLLGAFAALLVLGLFIPFRALILELPSSLITPHNALFFLPMIGVGAGIGLLVFIFLLGRKHAVSRISLVAGTIEAVFLACAAYRYPWLGTGFFAVALARQAGSPVLVGVAVLSLAAGVTGEYYLQVTSLLHKSLSLGAVGLFLVLLALALRKGLQGSLFRGLASASRRQEERTFAPGSRGGYPESPGAQIRRVGRFPFFAGMRAITVLACLALFMAGFAWSVGQKEQLLAEGRKVILPLRPLDPRSLMQGDYMTLEFAVEQNIASFLETLDKGNAARVRGKAVVVSDADGIFHFVRLDDGAPLADGEAFLLYRSSKTGVRVGSGTFFFQEGHGRDYDSARFAELRADADGNTLITHLLNGERQRIDPGSGESREQRSP